jgi:hypothetical protein
VLTDFAHIGNLYRIRSAFGRRLGGLPPKRMSLIAGAESSYLYAVRFVE